MKETTTSQSEMPEEKKERTLSMKKLAVGLKSAKEQAKKTGEINGLVHQQNTSSEKFNVIQQDYSQEESSVFGKIAEMDVEDIKNLAKIDPKSKEDISALRDNKWPGPDGETIDANNKKMGENIYRMFYQKTKISSLGYVGRESLFASLKDIFELNSKNPHLSNQMVGFINAKRNALDFKREFNIGGESFTETTVGIANLGDAKEEAVEISMESTLDSLDKKDKKTENPLHTTKAPSEWTFPKETEYKTAITSLVDSSLAGGVGGEASMSQRTVAAAEKINKEYDAAVKREADRNEGGLGKKAYEQVRQDDQDDTEKQDREIINRGKVVVTRGAAYNTVAQFGNWSTGNKNAEAKALIELQNKHMDALVSKMDGVSEQKKESVVAKFCTTLRQTALGLTKEEEKQKKAKESVRQDLRKLLANNMGLGDFKKKHNCNDMPDADLQKLALYAGRREVFEASKGFTKQFGAQTLFGKPTNNHIFHLAAATGMMKSMFGDHALEGCKSNKDRASMVRMMQMSMDRAMMQDPNWKLPKNPDQVTKAVSENPLVLMKEGGADEKDKDIKNMEALSERFRDLHYVDGNYDPYLSKVTAANAVGSEGALAHSETGVAGDSNNRAMMPAAFSAIYKVTRPDFLVRKQIDGFTADFNKGPQYKYVANAEKENQRVQDKFKVEQEKFNSSLKGLEGVEDEERETINAYINANINAVIDKNESYKDVLEKLLKDVLEKLPPDSAKAIQKAVLDYRAAYLEKKEWDAGMPRIKEAFLKSFEQLEFTADSGILKAKKALDIIKPDLELNEDDKTKLKNAFDKIKLSEDDKTKLKNTFEELKLSKKDRGNLELALGNSKLSEEQKKNLGKTLGKLKLSEDQKENLGSALDKIKLMSVNVSVENFQQLVKEGKGENIQKIAKDLQPIIEKEEKRQTFFAQDKDRPEKVYELLQKKQKAILENANIGEGTTRETYNNLQKAIKQVKPKGAAISYQADLYSKMQAANGNASELEKTISNEHTQVKAAIEINKHQDLLVSRKSFQLRLMKHEGYRDNNAKNEQLEYLFNKVKNGNLFKNKVKDKQGNEQSKSVSDAFKETKNRSSAIKILQKAIDDAKSKTDTVVARIESVQDKTTENSVKQDNTNRTVGLHK